MVRSKQHPTSQMKSHPVEEHAILNCISQTLFEDDLESTGTYAFPDALLEAAERSFYDALGEKNRSAHDGISPHKYVLSQDYMHTSSCNYYAGSSSFVAAKNLYQPRLINNVCSVLESYHAQSPPVKYDLQPSSLYTSCSESSHGVSLPDRWLVLQPPVCATPLHGQFGFENNQLIPRQLEEVSPTASSQADEGDIHLIYGGLRKRKSLYQLENETSRKGNKPLAEDAEDSEISEMLDMVLLSDHWERNNGKRRQNGEEISMPCQRRVPRRSKIGGKIRRPKWCCDGDFLDLRTLLTRCAEAVAGNDRETASELLLQIRSNSSLSGNGTQRLAHYFANALETRLNGTGNAVYPVLSAKRMSILTSLKCYKLYLSACPLIRTSNFFVNQTILNLAEKATSLHIIHFGIANGFQWPSLIRRLALRPGGPPLLRITGIDLPLPGFQPTARLEETGRRLANYCKRFVVPFEYNAIAQRWDSISHEDLKINNDDATVVNCLYRLRYLPDDTAGLKSSRDTVLSLIKSINPDIFIQGIVNGTYNAPFFVSRFKEALYYYSAVFDMLEANSSHELGQDRMVYEHEVCGRELMNVVACEGARRIERPETYKQWQARNRRAGLRQAPLEQEIMRKVKEQMKSNCDKDFLVDQDGQWLVQGWRGRILYALSCWKPA